MTPEEEILFGAQRILTPEQANEIISRLMLHEDVDDRLQVLWSVIEPLPQTARLSAVFELVVFMSGTVDNLLRVTAGRDWWEEHMFRQITGLDEPS